MMSMRCVVHGNYENCVEWRVATLKVAVACAVLRNKPPGQSVREFLNELKEFNGNKDDKWKDEYHRLKKEVLELRQQLALLTSSQQSTCDSQALSSECESQASNQHSQPLNLLTPPDSQSSDTESCVLSLAPLQEITILSNNNSGISPNHSEFLRAFFYLEHRLRASKDSINSSQGSELRENDVLLRSVFTVLRHVRQGMAFNEATFKTCRDSLLVCLQFLDHQSTWTRAIRDELSDMACYWLEYLQDSAQVTKAVALLVILADSHGTAIALADFLANRMIKSQKSLSTWKWDGQSILPQTVLDEFCSASYYVLLLERTIPRLSSNVKARLIDTLSYIDPSVHNHFPLFSFSMLRIVSLLSS